MIITRGSGILMHITSLPSRFGIGDLGPAAYRFSDFLADTGQRYWQILPINPTSPECAHSPYSSPSSFGFNTLLISPEELVSVGLLDVEDLDPVPVFPANFVDYAKAAGFRNRLFDTAFERFRESGGDYRFDAFRRENRDWLGDHALFVALKGYTGGKSWSNWPAPLRDREPEALERMREQLEERIERESFLQCIFAEQWASLRRYSADRKVHFIGDIPIYVAYDSVDVWKNPGIFKLDDRKRPTVVAGVPPDCFSRTGQLWGNPVYDWAALKEQDYTWWVRRIARAVDLYDLTRIDHFRGFIDYWEVPAEEETAENGYWVDGPGAEFFNRLAEHFPCLPIIAEDLGDNTPAIQMVLDRFGFPGMRVLLYAFAGDPATSPHAPHNHIRNCIVYTGTHDNETVRGWFDESAGDEERQVLFRYLGRRIPGREVHREFVRMALSSVARVAIVPVQDLFGMGNAARMNRPATVEKNWVWRLTAGKCAEAPAEWLRELAEVYRRV
ncbi:4-alpha-glucanotransferase [Methanoculleus taiwanensis]|uniref:4-alpha-glucanotransferase n=1 Tax=Methanoculleus taiwanensis TaxID=1550565 RepID=A0A498GYM9_9EURY|nr:4-alpha-glucanotransferase [Methanoculleus taiwanensis]RXE55225.1 4-alpha-glucanotransferase [Methanoculleus taiwanensis]